jgi:hypothetical protein
LQRGAILLSGNAPTIKITLWGLSTPQNAPFLGAIYPQKRCTFANVVGSYAINVPPTCLQSRPTHPVKSAFYTILLRFSWDIGICFLTTPLTAENGITGICSAVFVFSVPKNGPNSDNLESHFYTRLNIGVILTETKKTETVPTALPLL